MSAAAKVIDLSLHRRAAVPADWSRLGMLSSSPCKRDAAAMYSRLGLHPILIHGITEAGTCTCGRTACSAIGKHPVERGWQTGTLDVRALDNALNDVTGNWRYNIGLRMGVQPSGVVLVCIDVDGPRSLLEPLEREESMPFPETLTAKTSRGLHLIYRWPEGREPPTNRAGLAPKVDVRAVGGQIVAPPSRHVSGAMYEWIDTRAPVVLP